MVGLIQIVIYLLCACLGYKGLEIFQIALVAPESKNRTWGVVIGVLVCVGAGFIACIAIVMTEGIVQQIGSNLAAPRIP